MTFGQTEFAVRCEWGLHGIEELGPLSDVLIIVDVLSFTTAVDIATARGGEILPYPFRNETAFTYAGEHNATLSSAARGDGFSLSPSSLRELPAGYRLVLPSPNGAALAYGTNHPAIFAACLRNAAAVAEAASKLGPAVAVIPAGEMWPDGSLRPSLEDWLGAGAVIASLPGSRSPEAELAVAAFHHFRERLGQALHQSGSGKELIGRGFALDVDLAAELNVSRNVPRLINTAFVTFQQ